MVANFEALVPGLAELRAKERRNRARAFAGIGHTLCGVEVVPLTPGNRLALQLIGNAFTVEGVVPLDGDLFVFLWLLSPNFSRPGEWGHVLSGARQAALRRHVKRLDLAKATREIRLFMVEQLQDLPESSDEEGKDQSAWIHWCAMEAGFWINVHGGFTLESFRTTPYLVLQQLYRVWRCNHPKISRSSNGEPVVEEPSFINWSDRALGLWHADRRAQIAEIMRAPSSRLP